MFKPLGIRVNPTPAEADAAETIVVEEAITISRPRAEVYAFLQRGENLPVLAEEAVQITREVLDAELAWRATRADRRFEHFGSLDLRDAPGGRGTIVSIRLEYVPSGGSLGAAIRTSWGARRNACWPTSCAAHARCSKPARCPPPPASPPAGADR